MDLPIPEYNVKITETKYSPCYQLCKGIKVRKDPKLNWTLYVEINRERSSQSFGTTIDGLKRAVVEGYAFAEDLKNKSISTAFKNLKRISGQEVPTIADFAQKWFEDKTPKWEYGTQIKYEGMIRNHLNRAFFSGFSLDAIEQHHLFRWLTDLYKNRSASIVEAARSVVSGCFTHAINLGMPVTNPAVGILRHILPPHWKKNKKPADPFSKEELSLFHSAAKKICSVKEQMILKAMSRSGLRLGEAVAMKIEHLDKENGCYWVAEQFYRGEFKRPKQGSTRLIELHPGFSDELMRYLESEKITTGNDALLFPNSVNGNNRPIDPKSIRNCMVNTCNLAGLRTRTPKDLRHTTATLCLLAGRTPKQVQKLLGHSSVETTIVNYETIINRIGPLNWDGVF